MFDKISLRAMCQYEKLTGKNAMDLLSKENKSATDLRDLAFLVKATKDKTTTLETIEDMSSEDFEALMKSLNDLPKQ